MKYTQMILCYCDFITSGRWNAKYEYIILFLFTRPGNLFYFQGQSSIVVGVHL